MKALSLTQPWASLVAVGAKRIETRSWGTGYRGLLAIHASKAMPRECRDLCLTEPFASTLRSHDLWGAADGELPRGSLVAIAWLFTVKEIDPVSFAAWFRDPGNARELAFGNYETGRFAWALTDVRALPEPIPCRGALGLWEVPAEIATRLAGKVRA